MTFDLRNMMELNLFNFVLIIYLLPNFSHNKRSVYHSIIEKLTFKMNNSYLCTTKCDNTMKHNTLICRKKVLHRKEKRKIRERIGHKKIISRRLRELAVRNRPSANKKHKQTTKKKSPFVDQLPMIFSVSENLEGVIVFINGMKKYKYNDISNVIFDMSQIEEIDICAIVIFLTALQQLSLDNISYCGNLPDNKKCREIFEESGFLEHMKIIGGGKDKIHVDTNLIVKRGYNKAEGEITGKTIKSALKKLTGTEQHYQPVQGIVLEMIGNAIEHAYTTNKHWLFCVNSTDDEITFIVSDAGKGIIKTLKKKYKDELIDTFFRKDINVLNRAFDKKYGSATKEVNRNRGLPMIKGMFEDNRIKGLKVITNNVLLDFENKNYSRELGIQYAGTLYLCKIDKTNLE